MSVGFKKSNKDLTLYSKNEKYEQHHHESIVVNLENLSLISLDELRVIASWFLPADWIAYKDKYSIVTQVYNILI